MPPFEVGNALKNGVVDIANGTGAFYTNLMTEADAWKLTQRPMAELRKNGGFDLMAQVYAQKLHAVFLARVVDDNQNAELQNAAQQAVAEAVPEFMKENAAETERQAKAGIQAIAFDAANTM